MNDNKSRDIFYGVVAIATLIVALIGATLAYFSMNASSHEGAVNASAAVVSVSYEDGQQVIMQSEKLIPSDFEVVQKIYERNLEDFGDPDQAGVDSLCKSDGYNGAYDVCSVYRFTVKEETAVAAIVASLRTELNSFQDLAFAVSVVEGNTGLSTVSHNHTYNSNSYSSTWVNLDFDSSQQPVPYIKLGTCDNNGDTPCSTTSGTTKTYATIAENPIFGFTSASDNTFKPMTPSAINTDYTFDVVLFILNDENKAQDYDQGKQFNGTIFISTGSDTRISGLAND